MVDKASLPGFILCYSGFKCDDNYLGLSQSSTIEQAQHHITPRIKRYGALDQ